MKSCIVLQCATKSHAAWRPPSSTRHSAACRATASSNRLKLPDINVHTATDNAELRAAAYLRAAAFYHYPPDRSLFAMRSHRRLKADTEWKAVEARVQGTDPQWKDVKVVCLLATVPHTNETDRALLQGDAALDRSGQLPAGSGSPGPRLVVGTLDTNQGAALPSEELVGGLPRGGPGPLRAYLSNVCVADAARRQGVAQCLIDAAAQQLSQQGVRYVYVHVAADNVAAVELYRGPGGFVLEQEESEGNARALGRPRRLLLVREL